jgi:hypothetical protein
MRIMLKPGLAALAVVLVVAACGGGDSADVDASSSGEDADPAAADAADSVDPDGDTAEIDADVDPDADVQEGVACGEQTCGSSSECCFEIDEDPVCVDLGTCEGASLSCTSPTHCGEDEICCSNLGQAETTCVEECNELVVCDTEDDCLNDNHECCPVGDFGVCSPFCI